MKRTVKAASSAQLRYESRTRLLDSIKLTAGCADCGYAAHAVALQFDHLPGLPKVDNVTRLKMGGLSRLLEEVEKCEVVCACCHAVRTFNRKQTGGRAWAAHGIPSARALTACGNCGQACWGIVGYCTRTPECRKLRKREIKGSAPQPCGNCGQPAWSQYGYCRRTKTCTQLHSQAYGRAVRPSKLGA